MKQTIAAIVLIGSLYGLSGYAYADDTKLNSVLIPVTSSLAGLTSAIVAPLTSATTTPVISGAATASTPVADNAATITPVSSGTNETTNKTQATPAQGDSAYLSLASPERASSFKYPSTKLSALLTEQLYAVAGGMSILGLFMVLGGFEAVAKIAAGIGSLVRRRSMESMK